MDIRIGIVSLLATAACATASPNTNTMGGQIVGAEDRTEKDRAKDEHRRPIEMLAFFSVAPGMHVGELGAGGGYSTELFARAVGPGGSVVAQDSPDWDEAALTKIWEERLSHPALKNTTHFIRQWDEPFPPEAAELDAVYSVAIYHDVVAEKKDSTKMNAAVFAALRHGGIYAIIDNSANPGTGVEDCERFHRIDEAYVKTEVEQAGFKFLVDGDFLRNPNDRRDWNADPDAKLPQSHTQDRFALKFIKP